MVQFQIPRNLKDNSTLLYRIVSITVLIIAIANIDSTKYCWLQNHSSVQNLELIITMKSLLVLATIVATNSVVAGHGHRGTCASIGYSERCCPPGANYWASDSDCGCSADCHHFVDCCSDVSCPQGKYWLWLMQMGYLKLSILLLGVYLLSSCFTVLIILV